jgi:hypothetical protein
VAESDGLLSTNKTQSAHGRPRTLIRGLSRPSTPWLPREDVDARDKPRDKPAHDEDTNARTSSGRLVSSIARMRSPRSKADPCPCLDRQDFDGRPGYVVEHPYLSPAQPYCGRSTPCNRLMRLRLVSPASCRRCVSSAVRTVSQTFAVSLRRSSTGRPRRSCSAYRFNGSAPSPAAKPIIRKEQPGLQLRTVRGASGS